jgi:hypothetical protein
MRIAILLCTLFLTSCASAPPRKIIVDNHRPVLKVAQTRCMSKGFPQGSFEYDSCFRTSPEVESYERIGRLASLGIITKNRSAVFAKGRSTPVY